MYSEKLAFFVNVSDALVKSPEGTLERITSFLSDSDADVRAEAVGALGILKDTAVLKDDAILPLLIETYYRDTSDSVRKDALEELASFKSDAIFELLRQSLDEPNLGRRHRQLITQQLKNYDSSESIHLLKKLSTHWDFAVRDDAVDSLFHLNRVGLRRVWFDLLNGDDIVHKNVARKALRIINNRVRLGRTPR